MEVFRGHGSSNYDPYPDTDVGPYTWTGSITDQMRITSIDCEDTPLSTQFAGVDSGVSVFQPWDDDAYRCTIKLTLSISDLDWIANVNDA